MTPRKTIEYVGRIIDGGKEKTKGIADEIAKLAGVHRDALVVNFTPYSSWLATSNARIFAR